MGILAAMRHAGKLALLAVFLVSAIACGGSSSESDRSREVERAAKPEPAPLSETGKKWGGWRWKGKRQECFYVVDNECFATKKSACRAAGCGPERCREKDGTAPVKVRCKPE
jgi:hypothetical protein